MRLDSRPSDAIALALRADCPIFVDSEVIQARRIQSPLTKMPSRSLTVPKKNGPM